MKLNLACGSCKLDGYVNVDVNPELKPDLVLDVNGPLPWKDGEVDEIVLSHAIEHVEAKFHHRIYVEFHRILKPEGILILGYPEFSKCAQFWLDNHRGMRDFWTQCIFGRQCDPKDFHVCAMHTPDVKDDLRQIGFKNIVSTEERFNEQYTLLRAERGDALPEYSDVVAKLIFGEPEKLEVGVGDQNIMIGN